MTARVSWNDLSEETIARRLSGANGRLAAVRSDTEGHDSALLEHPEMLRSAAVLVPLLRQDGEWRLLFTRRAESLPNHKGQVSFPGGASEPEDASPHATALREALEEIGIQPHHVRILGELYSRPTITYFMITPVVGRIEWPYSFHLSPEEVSRVFTIPLHWLADPANREERLIQMPSGRMAHVIYYQAYDGEILWGASARITLDLLHLLS